VCFCRFEFVIWLLTSARNQPMQSRGFFSKEKEVAARKKVCGVAETRRMACVSPV
jgi:hypothetical protein